MDNPMPAIKAQFLELDEEVLLSYLRRKFNEPGNQNLFVKLDLLLDDLWCRYSPMTYYANDLADDGREWWFDRPDGVSDEEFAARARKCAEYAVAVVTSSGMNLPDYVYEACTDKLRDLALAYYEEQWPEITDDGND